MFANISVFIHKAKTAAAIKIQRLIRRSILRSKEGHLWSIIKKLQYFDGVKIKLHTDAEVRIAYMWRRYLR